MTRKEGIIKILPTNGSPGKLESGSEEKVFPYFSDTAWNVDDKVTFDIATMAIGEISSVSLVKVEFAVNLGAPVSPGTGIMHINGKIHDPEPGYQAPHGFVSKEIKINNIPAPKDYYVEISGIKSGADLGSNKDVKFHESSITVMGVPVITEIENQ